MARGVVGYLKNPRVRMKPLMIILASLALGLIFLGIVLTIVGHWPGYTSWGSNPLKYLGPFLLGFGIIILVGVVAHCCVMSEQDDPNKDYEKKEFVDINSAPSGENTPSVIVREQYDGDVKNAPLNNSAFMPYTVPLYGGGGADAGNAAQLSDDVNVLKMLKDSPSRDRKYNSNYNTGNEPKVPTPSFPASEGTNSKKNVEYDTVAYSSDGDRMKLADEQKPKSMAPYMQPENRFVPQVAAPVHAPVPVKPPPGPAPQQSVFTFNSNHHPEKPRVTQEPKQQKEKQQPTAYIQPASNAIPPEGPRRWGSGERILDGSGNGNNMTPPRSPKSKKPTTGNPSSQQAVLLEKPRNQTNAKQQQPQPMQMNNIIKRSRGRSNRQGSSNEPPTNVEPAEPDLEIKRTLIVPKKAATSQSAPKWGGSSQNKEADLSPVSGGDNMPWYPPAPKESTPQEPVPNNRDYANRDFSDPLGHTSRRERDRQSRVRQGGSRERGDRSGEGGSQRDRSSSGHRRHRSRSGDRDRGRTRDDYYSATSIDYVTGAPVRRSGRSKSQERGDRGDRYGTTGSRRTRSHDRGLNKSYDSSDEPYRRHHRGVINTAYDRGGSSDDSREISPRHKPYHLNQSNSTGTSADDFGGGRQIAITPNKRKQTMNFTINVNAQPGSAVQIAMGNQPLPPAQPMLPGSSAGGGNTSINLKGLGGFGDQQDPNVFVTQIPHDSSVEEQNSGGTRNRTRAIRT